MIFISHNHKDKVLIEPIAIKLASVYGQDKVFYDSWSIQPGEGLIDKMNKGLESCKHFFFFVSKNSLQSNMVALEWQNALLKATKGEIKLIPVKIDDCMMPAILLQTLYIDIFGQGLDVGIRQMVDLINGHNTFHPSQGFENIRANVKWNGETNCTIEFRAEFYLEPIARFLILHHNKQDEVSFECKSDGMCMTNNFEGIKLNDGRVFNAHSNGAPRGITPGFPYVIDVKAKEGLSFKFAGVMRAVNAQEYRFIPCMEINKPKNT